MNKAVVSASSKSMRTFMVGVLVVAGACSKPVAFQGQSTLAVVGTPPPPPPVAVTPPRVEVRDNKIEIREKIQFDYNKATIKEESFSLMKEIADVMKKNVHLKRIQIEGHASSEGNAAYNKRLSDERAKAVMAWLTTNGVAAERLSAIGFGIDRPIAENSTEVGRETNRRVEFLIVEQLLTKQKIQVDAKGVETVVGVEQETVKATPAAMKQPGEKSAGTKGVAQ